MANDVGFDCLINGENHLSDFYVPDDLVIMDDNHRNFHRYLDPKEKPTISRKIYADFICMQDGAKKEGLNIIVDSGYRSYNYQAQLYKNLVKEIGCERTRKIMAFPGTSEHQTGYAIDIASIRNGKCHFCDFDSDVELAWLIKNSYKYGFILRYPKNKERITGFSYEPWHYRYVGKDLAKYLYENNLTLEEYHIMKKEKPLERVRINEYKLSK